MEILTCCMTGGRAASGKYGVAERFARRAVEHSVETVCIATMRLPIQYQMPEYTTLTNTCASGLEGRCDFYILISSMLNRDIRPRGINSETNWTS